MTFKELMRAVRRHGFVNTLRLLPKNVWGVLTYPSPSRRRTRRSLEEFDRRFGVDTARRIEVRDLDLLAPAAANAHRYQPIRQIDEYLGLLPISFEQYSFVDYGCGKGRALLMASEFPFKEIIGVEHATILVEIAHLNVQRYKSATQKCKAITVIEGDAAHFRPPAAPTVYFLYNPFGRITLAHALTQIRRANIGRAHVNYLIYVYPRHRSCIEDGTDWTVAAEHAHWVIYRST
jgi:SAM-dependent methyltransferase